MEQSSDHVDMTSRNENQTQTETTEDTLVSKIPKYLEENKKLILGIMEYHNQGKVAECNQLQALLQKNLMYLAAIADPQPPPSGPSQVPPSSVAQQGNYMQPPQGAMMQQPPQAGMMQQPPQAAMSQQPPQGSMTQQQLGGYFMQLDGCTRDQERFP